MLVEELRHLNEQLGIPATLSEVGVTADKIPAMAEDAMKSGNIPANPRPEHGEGHHQAVREEPCKMEAFPMQTVLRNDSLP